MACLLSSLSSVLRSTSSSVPSITLPSQSALFTSRTVTRGRYIFRNVPSAVTPVRRISKDGKILSFKPITPGLRHRRQVVNPHLHQGRPIIELTVPRKKRGGRNDKGHVTVKGRGGGAKQRVRLIDFKRIKPGPHDIVRIEYDPSRTAHIALLRDRDGGALSYILAPDGLRAGDNVQSFRIGIPKSFMEGRETQFVEVTEEERRRERAMKEEMRRVKEASKSEPQPAFESLPDPTKPQTAAPPPPPPTAEDAEEGGIATEGAGEGGIATEGGVVSYDAEAAADVDRVLPTEPEAAVIPRSQDDPYDLIPDLSSINLGLFRSLALQPGNVLPLSLIPPGTVIHNVSLTDRGKAQLIRSAGTWGTMVQPMVSGDGTAGEGGVWAHVRLASGETRKIVNTACATIGMVSNGAHELESLGKAGRNRWRGRRPKVRGMAMNATDHPHGGGRGKSKGGKHPRTPYGYKTKGRRTRRPGPKGNTMVVQQRPSRHRPSTLIAA